MFTKTAARRRAAAAYTLVEILITMGVFSIAAIALMSTFLFTARSYAALSNYVVLNQHNRQSMDLLTREIRQARKVTGCSSNENYRSLTILDGDNRPLTYTFDQPRQRVTLTRDGETRTLLTNCSLLEFGLYMRPPTTNSTFDLYPVNMGPNWQETVKVIQLTWRTALTVGPTAQVNSEDIQTACIVIRKQQD